MLNYITSYLSSNTTPGQAGNVFWVLVYILAVFGGISVAVMAMNWLERKALAHFQIRLGPMRVGPHGLLQPIADAIKLMTKEDIIPAEADKFVFWIAPLIILCASFAVYIVVPFGPTHAITDLNIGILFMLGVSSLSVLGIVMAGWASNSHYPLIGALRSSAQMVSYEVAMGMAVVSAVLMTSLHGLGPYGVGVGTSGTGPLSMIGIVQAQQEQHVWFLFKFFPLGFIAFGIFAIAMVAETNRAPFDLPEAESELVAGFATEYSGMRYLFFFMAEWGNLFIIGAIIATLFLGGWQFPHVTKNVIAMNILQAITFNVKVLFLVFVSMWIRATLPRVRIDQLMTLCWKYFVPISFVNMIGTAVWVAIWPDGNALMGYLMLAAALALAAVFTQRVIYYLRRSRMEVYFNPTI
jgi:NADH-quinone oxidoreductase subunit H